MEISERDFELFASDTDFRVPSPGSNNPRTGARYGKWAQCEDGEGNHV